MVTILRAKIHIINNCYCKIIKLPYLFNEEWDSLDFYKNDKGLMDTLSKIFLFDLCQGQGDKGQGQTSKMGKFLHKTYIRTLYNHCKEEK